MRPILFLLPLLAACIDWNRADTLEDRVLAFQESEGILDATDCGAIDLVACEAEDDTTVEANACFADALAACEPATLAITRSTGDGETQEVLVIHPEGAEAGDCAVQRFSTFADGGKLELLEESCEGANIPTETCEAPSADSCVPVSDCGDATDCG